MVSVAYIVILATNLMLKFVTHTTSQRRKAKIYLWYDAMFTVTCIKEVPFSEIGNVVDRLYEYTCELYRTGAATEENLRKLRYIRPQV